ncbi:MAG: HAMP domain-containing histidine kinase [Pseudomonadota bacterium]|nr:HAMP domain-containing histidine kinase [Pseudomonadota bacterium]
MRRTEQLLRVLLRTLAFRMALWQAVLFLLVVVTMLAIVNQQMVAYARHDLRSEVATEIASLRLADAEGTLQAQLLKRVTGMAVGPDYYVLLDAQRRLIVGNLHYRPTSSGWHTVPLLGAVGQDHDDANSVELYVEHFQDGRWLVVGRDDRSVVEFGEMLTYIFSHLAAAAVVLVLLGGGLTSWRYLSRIDLLGERAQRVLEGEHNLLIEGSGRGDEIDRLAGRLNHMLARNKVLTDGMRQVSNDIAHDLRTPLIRVRQHLEQCLAESPTSASTPRVSLALHDLDAVLGTFAALLRISGVEARERRAGFAEHDLSAVFHDVFETYRPVAEDAGYTLRAEIESGLVLSCDRLLVVQSLVNLIENALHHTPTGTNIVLGLWRAGLRVVGYVEDNGPGIPVADRRRVLGRFVRLVSSRSAPGNGLGLALVAAVADLHGMELTLEDADPGLRVVLSGTLIDPSRIVYPEGDRGRDAGVRIASDRPRRQLTSACRTTLNGSFHH